MLNHSAKAIALLRGDSYTDLTNALAGLLKEARASLEAVEAHDMQQCYQKSYLKLLSHRDTNAKLRPFSLELPPKPRGLATSSKDLTEVAITNLAPTAQPPRSNDLSALWAWAQDVQGSSPAKAQILQLLHEIEQWYFQQAAVMGAGGESVMSCEVLQHADQLATFYFSEVLKFERLHCNRHCTDTCTDMLKVELRSREALVTWVMLCLAHRSSMEEFPEVSKFALPVVSDDLRHLVLSDDSAQNAVLEAASFVSSVNTSATKGFTFSTSSDSTELLAAEFSRDSPALKEHFEQEKLLAEQRIEAHWQIVLKMQATVRRLEEELGEAECILKKKLEDEAHALCSLKAAIQQAQVDATKAASVLSTHTQAQENLISHLSTVCQWISRSFSAPSEQELAREKYQSENAYITLRRQSDAASTFLSQLISDMTAHFAATQIGQAYTKAKHEVRNAKAKIEGLERRIREARIPPPHVYQPLPDCRTHEDECRMLLFFLYPELTGSFALLRKYCCAAQQCFVPIGDSGNPEATSHPHSCKRSESWVAFYNRLQTSCAYLPQSTRQATPEGQSQLIMFRQQNPPKQSDFGPPDVMEYCSREDGVWWPAGDISLRLWQGGPVARYVTSQYVDPFAAQDPVAVARSFTEPGNYHSWLQIAARRMVSTLCPSMNVDCFSDVPQEVEAARGNRILAEQGYRPQGMTLAQWVAFAKLRAYPHGQLRALCIAVREGHLLLDCPQVR